MEKDQALELARNSQTDAEMLASLAGQHIAVDRALACHPNATGELLESLIYAEDEAGNFDRTVRASVVSHPNVTSGNFAELACLYPEAAVRNPSLMQLVAVNASLLWRCGQLLEQPACPVGLIELAFESDSHSTMFPALRNPNLPEPLRQRLGPATLYAEAETLLDEFEAAQVDELTRSYVRVYRNQAIALPYAVPVYLPFNAEDRNHRVADQVICGFPFTSQAWPWPQDRNDGFMQPIAQIDLVNAGQLLGEALGDGLLQVWFSTDPGEDDAGSWSPLLRVVPRAMLTEALSHFYPGEVPWDPARESDEGGDCIFGLPRSLVPSARVAWIPLGRMYPRPWWVTQSWCEGQPRMNQDLQEKLSMLIEDLGLPCMDGSYLDERSQAVHIGGYVRPSGNEADLVSWTDDTSRLLFYVSEPAGIFTMAVTFRRDESGQPIFEVRLSRDR